MALDLGVLLAFVTSDKGCMHLRSEQFEGEVRFCIEEFADEREAVMERESNWGDYARGAVMALRMKGYKLDRGIVGVVDGSKGFHSCGISSSAALGVAFLLALEHANGLVVSKSDNVELGRMIENGYLGLRSGVLDQSAILLSQRHCLTLIRCANFGHEIIYPPWQQEGSKFKILLAFSGLRHALASQPGYNLRVDECRQAASILLNATGRGMVDPILGNITEEEYYSLKEKLQGGLAKRAEHFFSENARVVKGVNAWASGDLDTFGKLMSESGQSSIENYECGSEPLIQLRAILLKAPGVFGARFSGAGFRGFCAALVASDKAEEAAAYVEKEYKLVQPQLSKNVAGARAVIICNTGDSAHLLLV
ncbi:hypothetical protein O6H91_13G077200 [Diphasiastrum complanatum]|nr:hypothetical protein O6H91_13G077200 [Diphasiastrum complanatum]